MNTTNEFYHLYPRTLYATSKTLCGSIYGRSCGKTENARRIMEKFVGMRGRYNPRTHTLEIERSQWKDFVCYWGKIGKYLDTEVITVDPHYNDISVRWCNYEIPNH